VTEYCGDANECPISIFMLGQSHEAAQAQSTARNHTAGAAQSPAGPIAAAGTQTSQRSSASSLLLNRRTAKASAVDGISELVWRDVVRPTSFDTRILLPGLSPPKDQGPCAAVVAFAFTAAAEAAIALRQPELGRAISKQDGLSSQQLYFCQRDKPASCKQV